MTTPPCSRCRRDRPLRARGLCVGCYQHHRAGLPPCPTQRAWTGRERQAVLDGRASGLCLAAIAKSLGRTYGGARMFAARNGIPRRPKADRSAAVLRLHARGLLDATIAARLRIAVNTVRHYRAKLKLPANRTDRRETYRKLVRRLGGKTPAAYGAERARYRALVAGWPLGCTEGRARQLAAFEAGPLTAEGFGARVGLTNPEGARSAVGKLLRAGWLVAEKRPGLWPRKVYALAPAVRRGGSRCCVTRAARCPRSGSE